MMNPIRSSSLCLAFTLACLPACGDDGSSGSELGDELSGTLGEGDGDGDGDTQTDSEGEPAPESLAHEIDISLVEINQGVAVPIAQGGEWVDGFGRNAPIIGGRLTLLRAYWETTAAFEAREIQARLTIEYPDREPLERRQTLLIDKESFPGGLDRSFTFDFVEEDIVADMRFSISLWEVDPAYAALEPPAIEPVTPRDGSSALVGVQPEAAELEIVMVPVNIDWPGCNTSAPANELRQLFEDMMFMKNPTQVVNLTVRETPIVLTQPLGSLWEMMSPLQEARTQDGAADNVYYYGLMDACTTGIDGAGGMAFAVTPAGQEFGWQRVSTGLWYGDDQWAADTFVHEVGHTQGLAHVFCPGENAADPDPDYPHPDGEIGVWGFGLRNFQLYNPTVAHDYMSYCYGGNWSSDWTWSKNFERIRELTSWNGAGAPSEPSPQQELLIARIPDDGGEVLWSTARGRLPAEQDVDPGVRGLSEVGGNDALELALPALRQRSTDDDASIVSIALPTGELRPPVIEVDGIRHPLD